MQEDSAIFIFCIILHGCIGTKLLQLNGIATKTKKNPVQYLDQQRERLGLF